MIPHGDVVMGMTTGDCLRGIILRVPTRDNGPSIAIVGWSAATAAVMSRSAPARTRRRRRIINLIALKLFQNLLLGDFGISLRLICRLSLAVGILGMVEDSE
jgi:hypothetical protein